MSDNELNDMDNNLNCGSKILCKNDINLMVINDIDIREQIKSHEKEAFVVNNMDNKIDCLTDGNVNEHSNNFNNNISESKEILQEKQNRNNKIKRIHGNFPDKEYILRNSLLTDLYKIKHIRAIRNIFITTLILFFFKTLAHDFVANRKINLSIDVIKEGFGKFHIALVIWSGMQFVTLLLYYFYKYWATFRYQLILTKHDNICKLWNIICLIGFILYQLFFGYYTIKKIIEYDLKIASSMVVSIELGRFMMKNHAFIRTNVPKNFIAIDKIKLDDVIPNYKNYVYFLFAPTLIYRDNYPRTKTIRWNIVFWHFLEVIGVIFYIGFLIEHYFMNVYKNFGKMQMPASELVSAIFDSMLPGVLICVCIFYCILHAWLNATAELCKFGDRLFYRDWWNAKTYASYYRCWNIVVHEWIYVYVYKDIYIGFCKNRKIIKFLIITLSAIVHEIILSVSFRFFYPVSYIFFGVIGYILLLIAEKQKQKYNIENIMVWLAFFVGNGIIFSLYTIERYARINCTNSTNIIHSDGISWNDFIPSSWSCYNITNGFELGI